MAVKKTTKSGESATPAPRASAAKSAPKKAATGATKAAPKAKAATAAKSASATAAKSSAPTTKAAPKAKAAPVKLTGIQPALLKKISDAKDAGYIPTKGEAKALEALQTKKMIKRGTKDKTSGNYYYMVSKAGEKHLESGESATGA